jgi:outer membrane protein assembly factor BamB
MKLRLCLLALLPLLSVIVVAVPLGRPKWASLAGDWHRSGLSGDAGPVSGGVQWRFETDAAIVGSVTVGFDGRLYVACEDGRLYAVDASGSLLWVFDANTPLLSAPSIADDGSLYVGDQDGALYAVNRDGSLRWTYGTADAIYSSPAVTPAGQVYVASTDGTLYALGPDGTELWRFTTHGPGVLAAGAVFASPAVADDGTVYIGGMYDPNLYALNPADGSVKWASTFPSVAGGQGGEPFASPVVGSDGTIYQTLLYDSRLFAIEPNAGTIRWATDLLDLSSFAVPGEDLDPMAAGWSEPVVGPHGTIYVDLDDPYLRAVNPDGSIRWVTKLGELGGFTLTVDKNGLVYAACDDGCVYVVDPDGAEVTRFTLGGSPAYPVIAGEGLLIVTDSQNYSGLNAAPKNVVWAVSSQCPNGSN